MIKDAESILKICGLGTTLIIGCGDGKLVFDLLKKTCDAFGLSANENEVNQNLNFAPGRFCKGSLTDYPFNPEVFDTIIIGEELLTLPNAYLGPIFKALYAMTRHNLVLYFPNLNKLAGTDKQSRLLWNNMAIEGGFRMHPRSVIHNDYESLTDDLIKNLTFFQKIPATALEKYPLSWLQQRHNTEIDTSRATGNHAEAEQYRYLLAARKVRTGDTVVELGCGLGFGTAIMAACSSGSKFFGIDSDNSRIDYALVNFAYQHAELAYKSSDIMQLSFIPDQSVDLVVCFKSLPDAHAYSQLIHEIKRILKPDGRLIIGIENPSELSVGLSSTAQDSQLSILTETLSKYLILEERWGQNTGVKGKREILHLPFSQTNFSAPQWWIYAACADPGAPSTTSYHNPACQIQPVPMPMDFAKYYDNPWIYRTAIQLGERIADREILMLFCVQIINNSRIGSADQGAALCVLAYQILETGQVAKDDLSKLVHNMNKYDAAYDRNNPHSLRWAISLHYVAARLLLMFGNRNEALTTFLTCAEMNAQAFSPLLATKTVSARMYAGLILAGSQELDLARQQFELGITAARIALQSDWATIIGNVETPLLFGLQELAEIADIASQCAQALIALDKQRSVPGYFWDRINLRRFGLVEWVKSVENENNRLRSIKQPATLSA